MEKKESAATIFWHRHAVTKEDRQRLHGHKSLMVWLTGLSGSGKSTIANAVLLELFNKGISAYLLDGDNLRHGLNSNLSFSPEDRKENIRRTAETGKLFVDAGIIVLSALISPFREDRLNARNILGKGNFIEVYIKCPLEECEKRDPKGLYKMARRGEIKQFTGIDQEYEEPEAAELVLDTNESSMEKAVDTLVTFIMEKII
ncbi:adenylyl-sulfate kinase [Mesobacillus subterraneus]|uniref:Adenylyl-sulfate kinase n=1 Tax=Mesobacillus subterraneus TaxID=285983 RepID=A0A0D6Z8R4_9BACI|nr:adenylyl-sulfate kinase [Mesobacillus subterraneus]KIY21391.1 adenylylsulfate kinase [Mesobacillus subterraneus]